MLLGHRHDLTLNFAKVGNSRHFAIVILGILPELLLGLFLLLLLLILLVLVYPLRFCNLIAGKLLHLRDVRLDFLKPLRICSADVVQYGWPLLGRRTGQFRERSSGCRLTH